MCKRIPGNSPCPSAIVVRKRRGTRANGPNQCQPTGIILKVDRWCLIPTRIHGDAVEPAGCGNAHREVSGAAGSNTCRPNSDDYAVTGGNRHQDQHCKHVKLHLSPQFMCDLSARSWLLTAPKRNAFEAMRGTTRQIKTRVPSPTVLSTQRGLGCSDTSESAFTTHAIEYIALVRVESEGLEEGFPIRPG